MSNFKYRPDIDGLRAVAVGLVLLHHMKLGMPGGFVGVDMFFVISGFVITGMVLKEQQAGRFSLRTFWIRRIRRILPLSTCVVAVTLGLATFLIMPSEFVQLTKSAIAQQLMCANLYFYRHTGGYFDGSSDIKPLLHMWSLAVEEQFYLIYPILLVAAQRITRRHLSLLLTVLALMSLGYSQWAVVHDRNAAFYLLPSRAWELLLGGILLLNCNSGPRNERHRSLIGSAGLAILAASCQLFNDSTSFPGISALAPCLGTAAIIYANTNSQNPINSVLTSGLFVFVGRISFSLYLWHWPLLAITRYWTGPDLPIQISAGLLLLTIAVSVITWKYIETPFRHTPTGKSSRTFIRLAFASVIFILASSTAVISSRGVPQRFTTEFQAYLNKSKFIGGYESRLDDAVSGQLPVLGLRRSHEPPLDFIVWGDSHAFTLAPMLDRMAKRHKLAGAVAARSATPPLLGVWNTHVPDANEFNEATLNYIERNQVKNVLLVARWTVYMEGMAEEVKWQDSLLVDHLNSMRTKESAQVVFQRGLARTIESLQRSGVQVFVLKQIPYQSSRPDQLCLRQRFWGGDLPKGITAMEHRQLQHRADAVFEACGNGLNFHCIDPVNSFFDECNVSKIGDGMGCFYVDDDHLSDYGAEVLLSSTMEPVFKALSDGTTTRRRNEQFTRK